MCSFRHSVCGCYGSHGEARKAAAHAQHVAPGLSATSPRLYFRKLTSIPQMLTENLLCSRYCAGPGGRGRDAGVRGHRGKGAQGQGDAGAGGTQG